ncbi:hypothetical protein TNCV_137791 [Trichonephila clavipes]|nr:hypothetical protein TNCV_137791 [Trichonephila clavipes]
MPVPEHRNFEIGQVTRTTFELSALLLTPTKQKREYIAPRRFNLYLPALHGWSPIALGLEPVIHQSRVHDPNLQTKVTSFGVKAAILRLNAFISANKWLSTGYKTYTSEE